MTKNNKLNNQEELFARDCKLMNLKYEYDGYTGTEKWAVITELTEEELWDKYPDIISRYTPFVLLSMAQGKVIIDDNRETHRCEMRDARHLLLILFYLEEDMKMSEKNDFIQLPPIKKDTPSEVVLMIWQYLKLPEESRKRVKADLIDVHENCGKEDFQIPDLYDIVPKEEIAEFEDIMRKIITGIISEASGIATWVYVQKYEKHKTLDEMLQEWKGASQFIIVMDTWFERLMAE